MGKRQASWDEEILWTVDEDVVWEDGHGDTISTLPKLPPMIFILPAAPLLGFCTARKPQPPFIWNLGTCYPPTPILAFVVVQQGSSGVMSPVSF